MSTPAIPGRLSASDPDLTERQRRVFARLVALYRHEARPVSSERLGRAPDVRQSGTRLRQVLAELEGMGLLVRAHSAAARVPSAAGWEYFVRVVLEPAALPAEVEDAIGERLAQSRHLSLIHI